MPSTTNEWAGKRSRRCSIAPRRLRSSHLRDPVGPQIQFASELFMDEVAAALQVDPVEFRLRHVKDRRAMSR